MQTPLNPDLRVVEAQHSRRTFLVNHNKNAPRYGECGHKLAADNPGPRCGPCNRAYLQGNDDIDIRERYSKRRKGPRANVGRVVDLLDEQGLLIEHLAILCHLDDRTVRGWIKSHEAPLDAAQVIAQVLGTTVDELRA